VIDIRLPPNHLINPAQPHSSNRLTARFWCRFSSKESISHKTSPSSLRMSSGSMLIQSILNQVQEDYDISTLRRRASKVIADAKQGYAVA
jgi:hypothetical protein